jgi:hypothetical protein
MRLPRVRIWKMMVGVALIGITMGASIIGTQLWARSTLYRALAICYEGFAKTARRSLWEGRETPFRGGAMRLRPTRRTELQISAERYERLWRIYDRAARYPWLPVAPHPPEPKMRTLRTFCAALRISVQDWVLVQCP